MRVYRYEDEDGEGPLGSFSEVNDELTLAMIRAGRYTHREARRDGSWHDCLPTPDADGINRRSVADMDEPRAGVRSKRQLAEWFPEPCPTVLARHGFQVVAYDVPKDAVLIGGHQVVFDASRATKINLPGQVDSLKLAA